MAEDTTRKDSSVAEELRQLAEDEAALDVRLARILAKRDRRQIPGRTR